MNIVVARPPNFDEILKVFPGAAGNGVLFCYGDTIFSPDSAYVLPQLIAHEEVHERQQRLLGPELWWRMYLVDAPWRYTQELEAHVVEYHEFIKHTRNRQMQRSYLRAVAERLSGPLYGAVVTYAEAVGAILRG